MALIKKTISIPLTGQTVTAYYFLGIPVMKEETVKESESMVHRLSELELSELEDRTFNIGNDVLELGRRLYEIKSSLYPKAE